MSVELLLREFERVADAPNAVGRLRRFFLDLAVRGLLAHTNSAEPPADALLAEILRAPRTVTLGPAHQRIIDEPLENPPFQVPARWIWTRLGRICDQIQRGKSPIYALNGGPLVVSQKCVRWEGLDLTLARSITPDSLNSYEPHRFLRNQDLLWNSTGTGTIGRVARVLDPPARLVCDSHVTVVRCSHVVPEYVRTWLRSDHVYGRIEGDASGSTNQVELTLQMALGLPIPLPPLGEQQRIVSKVGELMTLCDELERSRAVVRERRGRLLEALLHEVLVTGNSGQPDVDEATME